MLYLCALAAGFSITKGEKWSASVGGLVVAAGAPTLAMADFREGRGVGMSDALGHVSAAVVVSSGKPAACGFDGEQAGCSR